MHDAQTVRSTSPLWWSMASGKHGRRWRYRYRRWSQWSDQVWYGVSNAISPSSSLGDVYRF